MTKQRTAMSTRRKRSARPAESRLTLGLAVESDKTSGEVLAAYFFIRPGKSAFVKEFGDGVAYADYNRKGILLGIELLGPCAITVLDQISRKEAKPIKNFIRNAVPREMALM